ncbi:uncharacterized protein LOC123037368 [Drosophila rhopaloa]|uniref:Integrase zinc-binding domain-containing protein n=1 Tax=Drosophila rhopaloa TaxID=1041015 RepID=A0ABM5J3P1_DRORH|nr:uncharacterized protein LOC123037368 [Drosophila rhopaloa]
MGQYARLYKTLLKDEAINLEYSRVLQEYIDLGHMTEVPPMEIIQKNQYLSFYLPHHAVVRPESKSTKLRVVFNASRKTHSQFALNDVLHKGPVLQGDLLGILLNWRLYKFVFNGDIEKMYRQILVHPDDRPFQRLIFRPKQSAIMKDFQLNTVTFGVNCAPFLAIRTLQQLATDCKEKYPRASQILLQETYVDDILAGAHTLEDAKNAQSQLIASLKSAGFLLKKNTANHIKLLENIAVADRLDTEFLEVSEASTTKTLGIKWDAQNDVFQYNIKAPTPCKTITKRAMLSHASTLFDPAGWLTPIVIHAKLLLQSLWKEGQDWDECVKPTTLTTWNKFLEVLPYIKTISIPRWVGYEPTQDIQLHGFSDASEKAYCAAIYIRSSYAESPAQSHLLVAKTKVAPLKAVSLSRLELCGAHLLARLVQHTFKTTQLPELKTFLWSDSTIVLAWLEKPPGTWKTFVANRTAAIQEKTHNAKWSHVKSHDNPADLGTRGCTPTELKDSLLWWHGPKWLSIPEENWPCSQAPAITPPEQKKVQQFFTESENCDICEQFTTYSRALRATARIMRWYQANPATPKDSALQIKDAKTRLIIAAQRLFYPKEYDQLLSQHPISNKSKLSTLCPIIDSVGQIRINSRLANANIPYKERFPILLPPKSKLTTLFIDFIHSTLLHAQNQLMLRAIRQEFFVPKLANLVKASIRKCITCTRFKQVTKNQIMAALPPKEHNFLPRSL